MKVIVKKKRPAGEIEIPITTEYIKLEAALKLCGAAPTGGAAKYEIQEGGVLVNDMVCTMRGKKLYPGDSLVFLDQRYRICRDAAQ